MPKKHRIDRVLRTLGKKQDCRIDERELVIEIMKGNNQKHDLGNKSWGKIDFLREIEGYTVLHVVKFTSRH